jgi:hypothetical protein
MRMSLRMLWGLRMGMLWWSEVGALAFPEVREDYKDRIFHCRILGARLGYGV